MNQSAHESHSALLLMDLQQGIVARLPEDSAFMRRLAEVRAAARTAGFPVIYVTICFRQGYPEVSPRNRSFSAIKQSDSFLKSDPAVAIHRSVAPDSNDIVVVKRRVSAFAGSDLEVILRAGNIGSLVLTGIATSGVVLSTVRAAADMDYHLTVLSDCCADADEEVHRVLTEKVFPRQATVLTSQEWIWSLQSPRTN